MGYSSQVKIVAGKKPAASIRRIIKKYPNCALQEVGTNEQGETLFETGWGKWYEDDKTSYPEVAAIMKVVDKYVSLDPFKLTGVDVGMEYARVGEENDDKEYRTNGEGGGYLSIEVVAANRTDFKATPPKAPRKPKPKTVAKATTVKPKAKKK